VEEMYAPAVSDMAVEQPREIGEIGGFAG
jgi:hypothetical protein